MPIYVYETIHEDGHIGEEFEVLHRFLRLPTGFVEKSWISTHASTRK